MTLLRKKICFKIIKITPLILVLMGVFKNSRAQEADSVRTLPYSVIQGTRIFKRHSAIPIQYFDSSKIERLNVLQLSDAVKFFSGVVVKDYGGVGGLKTVSVRGLGAENTAVSYDGIPVADGATGQVDLGKFSLDNVEKITLTVGQSSEIFQPARLLSSASFLNISSSKPDVSEEKKWNAKAGLKIGSFGFWNPQLKFENRLNAVFSTSVNAEYLNAKGNYPYTLYYGASGADSSSQKKRENSDVETFHAEAGLFGYFQNNGNLRVKCHYYQSECGLPNATVFYYDFSSQRFWDKNFFTQAHYTQALNKKVSIQANAKYNWSFQRYLNPDYLGSLGTQENNYYQSEGYLSGVVLYKPYQLRKQTPSCFSFSFAGDFIYNNMNADLPLFAYPDRFTWLAVASGEYKNHFMTLTVNLLEAIVKENVHYKETEAQGINYGKKAPDCNRFSPALSAVFSPFKKENISLRLMYKEIFRMPSFNDLYYSRVGNPDLQPENTWQYNAGIKWEKNMTSWLLSLSLSTDAYYNKVKNKIIAIPSKNIFEWSMQNIGKVDIYGLDICLDGYFKITGKYRFFVMGNYTFQKAWDVTSSTDPIFQKLYKNQIPYTPKHSFGGSLSFENPFVSLSYTLLYSGARYALGENIPENYLASYADQSLSFGKKMRCGKTLLTAHFEILNLTDRQYSIVRYFPMQGRSCRFTLTVSFPQSNKS